MARLVACEGHKGLPHEPITYLFNADHPYRCPLCETLDQLDDATHALSLADSRLDLHERPHVAA